MLTTFQFLVFFELSQTFWGFRLTSKKARFFHFLRANATLLQEKFPILAIIYKNFQNLMRQVCKPGNVTVTLGGFTVKGVAGDSAEDEK